MTIHHHPSDESMMRLAAGALGAGPALVVSVHLERCAGCRDQLARFEAFGGAVLDELPAAPLTPDLFGRTVERLEIAQPSHAKTSVREPRQALGIELPQAMQGCEVGPWKWLAPGFHWSKVKIADSPDAMLLKGRAGLRLPAHGHTGLEFMQVLSGSLSDDRGEYFPGDLDEADEDVDHQPVVGRESDCVCLAALEGDTRLHSILGRLMRPIVGF